MPLVRNVAVLGLAVLTLPGCNRESSNEPDDFAQRIRATQSGQQAGLAASSPGQLSPEQIAAERAAAERNGAVKDEEPSTSANKGPYADLIVPPSVRLDPKGAEPCRAVAMSKFVGESDSPALRRDIAAANKAAGGVRFVAPGGSVVPGEQPTRLNVMLDTTGVARDFRCG